MSSENTSRPDLLVDERTTAEAPADEADDPGTSRDELPFASPEVGIGGFFPHLEAPTDG